MRTGTKSAIYVCLSGPVGQTIYRRWRGSSVLWLYYLKLDAIQRWSAICRVWPWTLTYQKVLLCFSSQGKALYAHNAGRHSTTTRATYRQKRENPPAVVIWVCYNCHL